MEEDALTTQDVLHAALIYRAVLKHDVVVFEIGSANDHLIDRDIAMRCVRVALERGDLVSVEVPK